MKISLEMIKKNRRDIYFLVIGLALTIALIFVFIITIEFLVTSIEGALEVGTSNYTITKFNVNALKNLGIIESIPTSTQGQ
jgi:hypothetical protein